MQGKIKLLLMLFLYSVGVSAQDVIVKKNGSTILSKVLEVNIADVKYKKNSNLDGPTYTISTSDILSINYENGEKETFENMASGSTVNGKTNSPQGYIEKFADARNEEIITMYNRRYNVTNKVKKSNAYAKYCALILGVRSSSIMSNEDIELTFVRKKVNLSRWASGPSVVYCINLKNKTDRTIYR